MKRLSTKRIFTTEISQVQAQSRDLQLAISAIAPHKTSNYFFHKQKNSRNHQPIPSRNIGDKIKQTTYLLQEIVSKNTKNTISTKPVFYNKNKYKTLSITKNTYKNWKKKYAELTNPAKEYSFNEKLYHSILEITHLKNANHTYLMQAIKYIQVHKKCKKSIVGQYFLYSKNTYKLLQATKKEKLKKCKNRIQTQKDFRILYTQSPIADSQYLNSRVLYSQAIRSQLTYSEVFYFSVTAFSCADFDSFFFFRKPVTINYWEKTSSLHDNFFYLYSKPIPSIFSNSRSMDESRTPVLLNIIFAFIHKNKYFLENNLSRFVLILSRSKLSPHPMDGRSAPVLLNIINTIFAFIYKNKYFLENNLSRFVLILSRSKLSPHPMDGRSAPVLLNIINTIFAFIYKNKYFLENNLSRFAHILSRSKISPHPMDGRSAPVLLNIINTIFAFIYKNKYFLENNLSRFAHILSKFKTLLYPMDGRRTPVLLNIIFAFIHKNKYFLKNINKDINRMNKTKNHLHSIGREYYSNILKKISSAKKYTQNQEYQNECP